MTYCQNVDSDSGQNCRLRPTPTPTPTPQPWWRHVRFRSYDVIRGTTSGRFSRNLRYFHDKDDRNDFTECLRQCDVQSLIAGDGILLGDVTLMEMKSQWRHKPTIIRYRLKLLLVITRDGIKGLQNKRTRRVRPFNALWMICDMTPSVTPGSPRDPGVKFQITE